VFPNNIRSTAAGAAASSSYIFGFTINKLYFPMRDLFSLSGLFIFYGLINLLGMAGLAVLMPETESRSLADIEEHFADKSKTFDTHIVRTDKDAGRRRVKAGADNLALDMLEKF
jgi:Sugar (and other) transporter.